MKIKEFVRVLDQCAFSKYMMISLRFENGEIDNFSFWEYSEYELNQVYDERIIESFTTQKDNKLQIADYVLNIKGSK